MIRPQEKWYPAVKEMFVIKNVLLMGLIIGNSLTSAHAGERLYRCTDPSGNVLFTDQIVRCSGKKVYARPTSGHVKIYKFVDEKGVVHLADYPKNARYRLIYRGSATLQPFSGGTYSAITAIHRKHRDYDKLVQNIAGRYSVESELIHAVIQAESAYNPYARSPKGAVGLMQLMPGTAKRYGVDDRTDSRSNVDGGARYLRDLLKMFNNNKELALAGYNAGENAVKRYGYRIPPYKETRNYVRIVMGLYKQHKEQL